MEQNSEETLIKDDSGDEDCEIYFLQPASSPYNIKEKLEEANKALFEESFNESEFYKKLKIKFKEDLVDFEPDLTDTDDDVQSFESYNEVNDLRSVIEKEQEDLQSNGLFNNKLEVDIFTPSLPEDEIQTDEETDNEEIEEFGINEDEILYISDFQFNNKIDEISDNNEINFELLEDFEENDKNNTSDELSSSKELIVSQNEDLTERIVSSSKKFPIYKKIKIDCKTHCLEKINYTINKLSISEKPVCPALKLIKRKCCEENRLKHRQKLPEYTGLRSEYGLSLCQLETRKKRKEYSKIRDEKRRKLMEEYKARKTQQNEVIFSQWLKTIEKRKEYEEKLKRKSKYCAKVGRFSSNSVQERPKISDYRVQSGFKKTKRPETACVCVQISSNVLKRGFQVGQLIFKEMNRDGLNIVSLL